MNDIRTPRTSFADVAVVTVAAAAALALVLPYLTDRPFWFDELVSVQIAHLSPQALLEYVFGTEANMALYHVLLAPWLHVGTGEGSVRAPSIVFALATLPFLYGLARRLFDRRTAAIAVLLLSVNVSYVGHARDARSYALTMLLATASSFFLVRATDRGRSVDWAFWAVAAALAVWAHLMGGLVVAAQLAWLAFGNAAPRRRAAVATVVFGVLVLPVVLAVAVGGQGAQLDWLDPPSVRKLPGLFDWYVESWATLAVYFVGTVAALATAYRARNRRPYVLLLLWLLVPPAGAFLLSYVAEPVYLYRYFLPGLPALVLLVAAGFAHLRPVWLGIALACLALGLSVRTTVACQPDCKIRHDEWGPAARYVAAHARPDDAIVMYPAELRTAFDHYLGRERPALLYPARWGLLGGSDGGSGTLDAAMRRVSGHPRVWLVTWWLPSEPAHAALNQGAALVGEREFQGNVHVELYRLRRGGSR